MIRILGVKIDNLAFWEVERRIEELVSGGGSHYVVTTNPEFIVDAQNDPEFRDILDRADLSIPDGVGILAAAKYLSLALRGKNPLLKILFCLFGGLRVGWSVLFDRGYLDVIAERVSGSDMVWRLARQAVLNGWNVFLLGGWEGDAAKVGQALKAKYPKLQIVGTYSGDPVVALDTKIRGVLEGVGRKNHIDLLFVAYGPVRQEKWIARNLPHLDISVVMGVGGTFDFISGRVNRAPGWLRRLGLEWFFRLVVQPWRWRRIFKAVVVFPWLVFREKVKPRR